MVNNERLMKSHTLVLRADRLPVARSLLKPSRMMITNANFFEWIMRKHRLFRRRHHQFPLLVLLFGRSLPRASGSSEQHLNLSVSLSPMTTGDRPEKEGAASVTRPQEGSERSTPPLVTRALPLFSGTPKIAPALRFERPRHTLAQTIPSGNYPLDRATPGGAVRAPMIQEGRGITHLGTHAPALYQAVPLSGRDLRTSAASHKAFQDSKGPAPSDAPRPLTDGGTPFLRYHTPLNIAIDALKESIQAVEKKVAGGEHLIQKTAPDNLHLSDAGPDSTKKMNIDLTHLTDQLYRMLERKIKGERERRGLYG